ncbi:MAG: glycosyltransferase [Nanoarchaeota archaeon]|nr:glycosyltransferase [Nanoarchaeota archaeon]
MEKISSPKADFLFEVSWEVCHQVGGIYTVIESKAARIYESYKEKYFLIGPYFEKEASVSFEKEQTPDKLKKVFTELRKESIICRFGKWIMGSTRINTILIDFSGYMKNLGDIKKQLQEDFGIDTTDSNEKFDESILWSITAGKLLEGIRKELKGKIIAHFHEYMVGAGLLHLKKNKVKISTVFTTHATILGRKLASSGVSLYDVLKDIKPENEAKKLKIVSRYQLEKATAKHADIFTTVSDITALEARHLVGRKPDIILPNGLDISKFPKLEERAIKHNLFKKQIQEFVKVFFFPYYKFKIKKSLLYFIAGRYEFKNKGLDIHIKSLGQLNKKLMKEKDARTIIALIWVPSKVEEINPVVLQNKINYEGIKNFMDRSLGELKEKMIDSIVKGRFTTTKELFGDDLKYKMKKRMIEFKKTGKPPILTHILANKNDEILKALRKAGLNNSQKDKVKVIYYPIYLTGADGLIDLNYYDAIMACHLGVFPSYYEPWGYTPLETGALGVCSVTTDLSGFGKYILKAHKKEEGIYVLKRQNNTEKQSTSELTTLLYNYSKLNIEERVRLKLEAKHIAKSADWKYMVEFYIQAHNLALKKLRQ